MLKTCCREVVGGEPQQTEGHCQASCRSEAEVHLCLM